MVSNAEINIKKEVVQLSIYEMTFYDTVYLNGRCKWEHCIFSDSLPWILL